MLGVVQASVLVGSRFSWNNVIHLPPLRGKGFGLGFGDYYVAPHPCLPPYNRSVLLPLPGGRLGWGLTGVL